MAVSKSKMAADLIIGIDLGMTFTGVGYYVPQKTDPERAKLIQSWPGKEDKTENKVPTSLIYHDKNLESWGFLCDRLDRPEHPNPEHQQYFKLWLDKSHLQEVWAGADAPTHNDVKRWFTDFLGKLYQHIERTFSQGLYAKEWQSKVHFVFSVPTTWKTQNVFKTYKQCIQKAGFGSGGEQHSFFIGLTEAEAAAIHTLKSKARPIKNKEMILVCDAGGGTTDAALLEAVTSSHDDLQVKQFGPDFGKPVGSVNIDRAFVKIVKERLQKAEKVVPSLSDDNPDWAHQTAWEMAQGAFQYHKCAFGTIEGTHEKFKIKIPDFGTNRNLPAAFIEKKHMLFTRQDMRALFDAQLEEIYSILDSQLSYLASNKPTKDVKYLALSGGLGNSAYIKEKLIERYLSGTPKFSNTKHMEVITAEDPQTAVVQGLVLNKSQEHETGEATLQSRTSPASYGVLCKHEYDKTKHIGCQLETDELDGKQYAINLIHWFVKKGDSVSEDEPISYNFMRKLSADAKLKKGHWESTVVISWNDLEYLPISLEDDAMTLCKIVSDTSHLKLKDFEKVAPRWYNPWGEEYYIAKYKVRVIIEVADILFEVWCNGRKLSKDQRIDVRWKKGAEKSRPVGSSKSKDIFLR